MHIINPFLVAFSKFQNVTVCAAPKITTCAADERLMWDVIDSTFSYLCGDGMQRKSVGQEYWTRKGICVSVISIPVSTVFDGLNHANYYLEIC